ncbi:MAG: hypothetical protein ABEJ70_09040 [Halobacteriaceae archaeon]
MDDRLSRRELLTIGGLAAASTIAGCQGESSERSGAQTGTGSRRGGTRSASRSSSGRATTRDGPDSFVSVDGTQFSLDGTPWYFNGVQYSSFFFEDDDAVRAEVLRDADRLNVNLLRTHGGCAGRGPANERVEPYTLQPEPGELNEAAFELLDRSIAQS